MVLVDFISYCNNTIVISTDVEFDPYSSDVTLYEEVIDRLIYGHYDLTEEEIAVVGSNRK